MAASKNFVNEKRAMQGKEPACNELATVNISLKAAVVSRQGQTAASFVLSAIN